MHGSLGVVVVEENMSNAKGLKMQKFTVIRKKSDNITYRRNLFLALINLCSTFFTCFVRMRLLIASAFSFFKCRLRLTINLTRRHLKPAGPR